MPAHAADCEHITDAFLSQPVNALSSLLFALAGVVVFVLIRRAAGSRSTLATAFAPTLVFVAFGSVAFHGPAGRWADWAHDGSTATLLLLVIAVELGDRAGWSTKRILPSWLLATVAALAIQAIWPDIADSFNAPLALVAVLGTGLPLGREPGAIGRFSRQKLLALGLVAVGGAVLLLSRTGGPLCDPDTLLQGHAVWHLLAATGLGLYVVAVCRQRPTTAPPS